MCGSEVPICSMEEVIYASRHVPSKVFTIVQPIDGDVTLVWVKSCGHLLY